MNLSWRTQASQKQRGSNNAAPGSETAALLAEEESLVKAMTAFASRQPTIPHTRLTGSAVASTTGAYDPISYVGATERPTSSGLNTGL